MINTISIVPNKYSNRFKYFLLNNQSECLHSDYIELEKGSDPDLLLANLSHLDTTNIHRVLFLPAVCLSQTKFKFINYSNGPIAVNNQKIVSYFENKAYRAERKEALITVTIFLSRHIKCELLGVSLTINQIASVLGMSIRRVSDTLVELASLSLIERISSKYKGLSLPGVILIKHDFFLEFYDGFRNEDKDDMIVEIEDIKKTRIDSKTNTPVVRYENPVEAYFSHLNYMAQLKNNLLDILRAKNTDDRVKEHIYLLLNIE